MKSVTESVTEPVTISCNFRFSGACGIELDEEYVVTGGYWSEKAVTQYNVKGNFTYLADLLTGRYWHACSKYTNKEGETVSLKSYINVLGKF